jgi:hypothetical protein
MRECKGGSGMKGLNDFDDYDKYVSFEDPDPYAGRSIAENGEYLCVQWGDHPVHVYRRIRPGDHVHRYTDQIEHNGAGYQLELIMDEKEHATRRAS